MRFILSVLLATALLGTMAMADIRHGQQASFRLERRQNQPQHDYRPQKVDHSHHRKGSSSSSKKQRRDLQETMIVHQVPSVNMQDTTQRQWMPAEQQVPNTKVEGGARVSAGLHSKRSHKKQHRAAKHSNNNNNNNNSKKRSSSSSSTRNMYNRRDLPQDLKADHDKHICLKCYKNLSNQQHRKHAHTNEDTELAFHRKISSARKFNILGQRKKSNQKNKIKRELLVKAQDIKHKKAGTTRPQERAKRRNTTRPTLTEMSTTIVTAATRITLSNVLVNVAKCSTGDLVDNAWRPSHKVVVLK
ncbi:hypothetical protein BGZ65_011149 [Modicella reniformis]|uniref:C2H2-type domain-containing protein n=1 Tax=Modicella reniformis TaxID=1440133 RepID=A0A9P6JFN0_9FUNG|nr:hypothetical protein BGZ65_011149 [Modicella reniformis]